MPAMPSSEPKKRALTVHNTCKALDLGPTKVNELIRDGVLKSVKIGRRRLVVMDSIDELLNQSAA